MMLKQYPLSPLQQGMLFHSLYEPDAGFYIQQLVCTLRERVDAALLHRAWLQVVERHAVLRTSFNWEGLQRPVQEVHSTIELEFDVKDWRGLNPEVHRQRFNEYLRADRLRGFDLSKAPLMRIVLFQLADHCQMLWTFHHSVLDGRSDFLLLTEVLGIYDAAGRGEQPELQDSRPYSDYIEWLEKNEHPNTEAFWRERLSGFVAPTPLPGQDKVTTGFMSEERHSVREIRISESVTSELKSLAEQNELTLNNLVQGSWALLLSRYSGEEDVVFGTTRACRRSTVEGADSMVGLFINAVPFRVRVDPQLPLIDWLKELRSQHVSLRPYEHTPLLKIQEWSEVPRGTPLFETLFTFENYQWSSRLRALGDPWASREVKVIQQGSFALEFAAAAGSDLVLKLEFDQTRFEAQSIDRMLAQIKTVLEAMVTHSDQQIGKLSLLTEEERQQVLVEWNQTTVQFPENCLHQLFEEQVNRSPGRVAVVYEDQQLTYAELNARSNQLARHLRSLGVGPETVVGICIERSLEMVIGLLGILKAGGAYLPLDPGLPKERLAFMLEDAGVPVLVTMAALSKESPLRDAKVVALDEDQKIISAKSGENLDAGVTDENLAYVIYTSGSTGRPKGTMNTHRGLCNRLLWMQAEYQLTEADRVLQKTPYSFDVSVWEFFWPLISGARLIMARPGGHQDPGYLVDLIQKEQITTLHFVPSMMQAFVEEKGVEQCATVRQVISSGEALTSELQERFFGRLNCKLHNLYGPTEAAIDVTAWECERGRAARTVPIGRPIANTQIYILDESLQPVPIGVPGELHIGGKGLGRGYLHRPDLTAEKFVPDPYAVRQRLYKTGDVARYQVDGNIEYLGRLDNQVKIRGFRIELGEIETVLSQYPGVRTSAVVMLTQPPGGERLVAYVVSEEASVNSTKLREYLRTKLPEYMLPTVIVEIEELPLTPNGKVDRRALPAPQLTRSDLGSQYEAPRTPTEEVLAFIWSEILNVDGIGIHDNFFQLGGHSLLATQVISRIRDRFKIHFPLRRLFEFPTIAELADAVGQAHSEGKAHSELQIKARLRDKSTLLENLDNLSAEQIDSLLSEALSKLNANK